MSAQPDEVYDIEIGVKNLEKAVNLLTKAFANGMNDMSERVNKGASKFEQQTKRLVLMDKLSTARTQKRYELMNKARTMEILTRAGGGGIVSSAMNFAVGMGQAKMGDMQRLQELRKTKLSRSGVMDSIERNTLESSPRVIILDKISQKFDKYFGGSSKWDKMFGGHGKMAAGAIGLGAVGIGAGLIGKGIKIGIESSPLLQQMLKLQKFGVMMLLRPIASFFGMVMRPIMILMLRKFIIPFYQKYMPVMMKLGDTLGTGIANWLNNLFGGGTKMEQFLAALTGLGGGIGLLIAGKAGLKGVSLLLNGKVFTEAFKGFNLLVPDLTMKFPDWFKKWVGITKTPVTTPVTTPATTTGLTPEVINKSPVQPKITAINRSPMQGNQGFVDTKTGKITSPEEMAKIKAAKQAKNVEFNRTATKSDKLFARVADVFKKRGIIKGVESLKSIMAKIRINPAEIIKNFKHGGLPKGGGSVAQIMLTDLLLSNGILLADGINQLFGNEPWFPEWAEKRNRANENYGIDPEEGYDFTGKGEGIMAAMGGILNEPVIGFGQNSGKKYTFGEQGREAIVPLNKTGNQGIGGTTINVNIQNMSGSNQDLNNLRRTILNVIQESSVGRVRA